MITLSNRNYVQIGISFLLDVFIFHHVRVMLWSFISYQYRSYDFTYAFVYEKKTKRNLLHLLEREKIPRRKSLSIVRQISVSYRAIFTHLPLTSFAMW